MKTIKESFIVMPFFLKVISVISVIEGICFIIFSTFPNAVIEINELRLERLELLVVGVVLISSILGFLYRKHWARVVFCLPYIYFAIKAPTDYGFSLENTTDITWTGVPLTLIVLMLYLFNKATVREYFQDK